MEIEELKIKYPSGLEHAVHMTKEELEHHIRLMAALKMFELGKVSSGKAAELAGMSRIEFLETCGRYRVSLFNYPPEEAEEELKRDLEEARKRLQQ
jgi:predicted HTH domain antitoxin